MSFENIEILSLNPHFYKHAILCFLTGYGKPCDLRLVFMVLPILLYAPSRSKLAAAKSTSRLESLFNKPVEDTKISGKTRLVGFAARYEALQPLTKKTIIILFNENQIAISEQYIIHNKQMDYKSYHKRIGSWMKAAYYLGVVFSKTTEDHISYFLGVSY